MNRKRKEIIAHYIMHRSRHRFTGTRDPEGA